MVNNKISYGIYLFLGGLLLLILGKLIPNNYYINTLIVLGSIFIMLSLVSIFIAMIEDSRPIG